MPPRAELRLPVKLLASPLQTQLIGSLAEPVLAAFEEATGVVLVPTEDLPPGPGIAALLLTGGTEARLLELAADTPGPVLVLTHGAHNSLPAGLEAVARLRQEGRPVRLVHLGDEGAQRELPALARAFGLAQALRGKRVGLVGKPSPWLVASSPDPEVLWTKLGVEVVELPLEEVLGRLPQEAPAAEGEGEGIGPEARAMGPRVEAALSELVAELELDAVSVACFDLLPHSLTACWALAHLADRGIPGGCEGDLTGLLTLMLSQELTGGPGFLANPVEVDVRGERLVLAHCTVPLSLTSRFRLRTHFESGIGLAIAGEFLPGPYTLVRFGGPRLEEAFVVEGTVLPERPGREDLCRTQVVFKAPRGALRKLLQEPLGNHHALVPGLHRRVLSLFHSLFLTEG